MDGAGLIPASFVFRNFYLRKPEMNIRNIKRSDSCLNCGTALDSEKDNFCPVCGQINNVKKETAFGLVRELVEEFLHLDSKVTRSLIPLLIKPGYLTKDYNNGRRARYFHPVRMFLTLTVIMFIVAGINKHETGDSGKKSSADSTRTEEIDSTLVFDTDKGFVYEIDSVKNDNKSNFTWSFGQVKVDPDTLQRYIDAGYTDTKALMDSFGIEKTFFNELVFSQIVKKQEQGFENISDYYKQKLPWMLFALMPVFAFVLYLLYIRRKIFFVDHLIHAFHLHSAVFLIMSLEGLLYMITGLNTDWLLLYVPIYYFVSLHTFYQQSWIKTLFKGVAVGILYFVLGLASLFVVAAIMFLLF